MGQFVVEIPPGSGNRYRYHYNPESQQTEYRGPVGDSPTLNEADFNRWLIFKNRSSNRHEFYTTTEPAEREWLKKWLEEDTEDSSPEWSSYFVVPGRDRVEVGEDEGVNDWFFSERDNDDEFSVEDELLEEDFIGEFETWKQAVEAMHEHNNKRAEEIRGLRKRLGLD